MLKRALVLASIAVAPLPATASTLLICRTFDPAAAVPGALVGPSGSVFRDNGRMDDPLAAFGGERVNLRIVTGTSLVIPPLSECGTVTARIASDSGVRAVTPADARMLVYAGSMDLLNEDVPSEEILTLRARALDQIQ
jgi:hypothetical protein